MANQSNTYDSRDDGAAADISSSAARERTHGYIGGTINAVSVWRGLDAIMLANSTLSVMGEGELSDKIGEQTRFAQCEQVTVQSKDNDQLVETSATINSQYEQKCVVGYNTAVWSAEVLPSAALHHAPAHMGSVLPKSADGAAAMSLTKQVSAGVLTASAQMSASSIAHMARNDGRPSEIRNNNDASGFIAMVLARAYAHNSARRMRYLNGARVYLNEGDASDAGTYLLMPTCLAVVVKETGKHITGIAPQYVMGQLIGQSHNAFYRAVELLLSDDVSSVLVATDLTTTQAVEEVPISFDEYVTPYGWLDDMEGELIEDNTNNLGCRQMYALFIEDGAVYMGIRIMHAYLHPQAEDTAVPPAQVRARYNATTMLSRAGAAAFLLGRHYTTFDILPGCLGWANRLSAASFSPQASIALGLGYNGVIVPSFTPAEIAEATSQIIRGFGINVGCFARAQVLVSEMASAMVVVDELNTSLTSTAYAQQVAPVVCLGVQYWEISDLYGNTDARDVGTGYDIKSAIKCDGVLMSIFSNMQVVYNMHDDLLMRPDFTRDTIHYAQHYGAQCTVQAADMSSRVTDTPITDGWCNVGMCASNVSLRGVTMPLVLTDKYIRYSSNYDIGKKCMRAAIALKLDRKIMPTTDVSAAVNHKMGRALAFEQGVALLTGFSIPCDFISPRRVPDALASVYNRAALVANVMDVQNPRGSVWELDPRGDAAGINMQVKVTDGGFGTSEGLVTGALTLAWNARVTESGPWVRQGSARDLNSIVAASVAALNGARVVCESRSSKAVVTSTVIAGDASCAQMMVLYMVYNSTIRVRVIDRPVGALIATNDEALVSCLNSGSDTVSLYSHAKFVVTTGADYDLAAPTISDIGSMFVNGGMCEEHNTGVVHTRARQQYQAGVLHVHHTDTMQATIRAPFKHYDDLSDDECESVRERMRRPASPVRETGGEGKIKFVEAVKRLFKRAEKDAVREVVTAARNRPLMHVSQPYADNDREMLIARLVAQGGSAVCMQVVRDVFDNARAILTTQTTRDITNAKDPEDLRLTIIKAGLVEQNKMKTVRDLVKYLAKAYDSCSSAVKTNVARAMCRVDSQEHERLVRALRNNQYIGSQTSSFRSATAFVCLWQEGMAEIALGVLASAALGILGSKSAGTRIELSDISLARCLPAGTPERALYDAAIRLRDTLTAGMNLEQFTLECTKRLSEWDVLAMPLLCIDNMLTYGWQYIDENNLTSATVEEVTILGGVYFGMYSPTPKESSDGEGNTPAKTVSLLAQRCYSASGRYIGLRKRGGLMAVVTHYIVTALQMLGVNGSAPVKTVASDDVDLSVRLAYDGHIGSLTAPLTGRLAALLAKDSSAGVVELDADEVDGDDPIEKEVYVDA